MRDARDEPKKGSASGERVVVDEGELDKRLLVVEPEMAVVLKRINGEGNTLSSTLRQSWTRSRRSRRSRSTTRRWRRAHISVVAHITQDELVTQLTDTDRANGFGNRFLYLLVKRSKSSLTPPRCPTPCSCPSSRSCAPS